MLRWWAEPPRIHYLTVFWALCILVLSAIPGKDLPEVEWVHVDKLAHLLVYALFFVLTAYSLRAKQIKWVLSITLLIVTGYGLLMECMQGGFFEDRYFDSYDALANGLGGILGIAIISIMDRTF